MNASRRQPMKSFKVTLSNGKVATVEAPSSQRALGRIEKMIADRGSKVTVISVL